MEICSAELLAKFKEQLNITDTYFDNILRLIIAEITFYLATEPRTAERDQKFIDEMRQQLILIDDSFDTINGSIDIVEDKLREEGKLYRPPTDPAIDDPILLEKVKLSLGITGNHLDEQIKFYIIETKQFLMDGGVSPEIVNTTRCTGLIARGVADLWNNGSGEAKFSQYFVQRAAQLGMEIDTPTMSGSYDWVTPINKKEVGDIFK